MKLCALKPTSCIEVLFVIAVLLNIVNYHMIQLTLIPLEVIGSFFLLGILIIFILGLVSNPIWHYGFEMLMYCVVIFGTYLTFLCLMINVLFCASKVHAKVYKVERITDRLVGRYIYSHGHHIGLVTFENGRCKRVYQEKLKGANTPIKDSIVVFTSDGFLKYPIIRRFESKN